ncbi:MAG: HD domain-containing protein [Spirochaetales bacterium]|nr:HD domain-containing protein [Spirochaetales bacterium]
MMFVPHTIRRFARVFTEHGFELYVVGGAVRDALLGRRVTDYDFATSATPEEVTTLFRRCIPTGIRHGTVTVIFEGNQLEVTTYRVDGTYEDHRRPDSVTFTRTLAEDLGRRDLTINAIALDPITGAITDPHDGRGDLRRRIIRTVGVATARFSEDALRMLRAVRLTASLEFDLDGETKRAIIGHAADIAAVSMERVLQELSKMMESRRPSVGWRLMRETGLLGHLIPELLEDRDASHHAAGRIVPVFDHLLASCDCVPARNTVLRWAALLHDVAKPRCLAHDERGIHFHGHDRMSAEMARDILTRLRSSNDLINRVAHLIDHHMFGIDHESSEAALRRFLARVGIEHALPLVALRRADRCGKAVDSHVSYEDLARLERRLERLIEARPAVMAKDLAINGRDLMSELSLKAGPSIGVILNELLQTVIDDPTLNTRPTLLEIATRFYRQRLENGE